MLAHHLCFLTALRARAVRARAATDAGGGDHCGAAVSKRQPRDPGVGGAAHGKEVLVRHPDVVRLAREHGVEDVSRVRQRRLAEQPLQHLQRAQMQRQGVELRHLQQAVVVSAVLRLVVERGQRGAASGHRVLPARVRRQSTAAPNLLQYVGPHVAYRRAGQAGAKEQVAAFAGSGPQRYAVAEQPAPFLVGGRIRHRTGPAW